MSLHAIKQLEGKTPKTEKYLSMIYGESATDATESLIQAYKDIIQSIEKNLNFRRENIFTDENGDEVPTVLSGADTENNTIIIYDAFFKKAEGDEKGLNARSTVILHEIAHLIGLEGDEEERSLESAEALRNFTLLVCEIIKPEDLFVGDEDDNEENAELIYK